MANLNDEDNQIPKRICIRCAAPYCEQWRTCCTRCGNVIVATGTLQDGHRAFQKALGRAEADGWIDGIRYKWNRATGKLTGTINRAQL